jgi:hypothetical protein
MREDSKIIHDLQQILEAHRTSRYSGGKSGIWRVSRLCRAVGVVDDKAQAVSMLRFMIPSSAGLFGFGDLNEAVGFGLHTWPEEQGQDYLIVLACAGVFGGHTIWHRLAVTLVQGAWPWLRGFTKTYAMIIFTLMVSLCSAVEQGYIDSGIKPLLMQLAATLIGRDDVGGPWRIRTTSRLKAPKILLAATPSQKV